MANSDDTDLEIWTSIISRDPIVIATQRSFNMPLGFLSVPNALTNQACTVFLGTSWSLEGGDAAKNLVRNMIEHITFFPHHRIILLTNTQAEKDLLASEGANSILLNQNSFLSDEAFRPIVGVEPEFDAVYTAALLPYKRHDLAEKIDSLALMFHRDATSTSIAQFHANYEEYCQKMPRATFINPLTQDGCERLTESDVNMVYARSRVGLCLSPVEGAMRASIEYLMAGLPIVSIPNKGGRDYFFDPDFCLTVKDDPRSVAEAVEALVRRNIPRDYIRDQTLKRLQKERERFVSMVDEIVYPEGGNASSLATVQKMISNNKLFQWSKCQSILDELTP